MTHTGPTYYELFSVAKSEKRLKEMMADAIKIAMFYGGNPDRLKAIEDAGNQVAKEKRWQE